MRGRRPAERPDADKVPDGLSRRGWVLLVAATAVVGVVLLVVAIATTGVLTGNARAAESQAPPPAQRHTPDLETAPRRLGLPPRPTATPIATVPAQPIGSIAPGDCLQTYESKWADGYPVVECSAPHIAQLLSSGTLPQAAGSAFPGTAVLDGQVSDLCEPVLNWHWVAIWGEDVQLDLRYPDTSEKWATGDRSYYCIVYTFSRHELTGSAVAGQ